jgi:adenylate cyclase
LSKLGQVAANDFVVDTDGKIRRSLLSLKRDKSEKTIVSLGAALALNIWMLKALLSKYMMLLRSVEVGKTIFTQFDAMMGAMLGRMRADTKYSLTSQFAAGLPYLLDDRCFAGAMPADSSAWTYCLELE